MRTVETNDASMIREINMKEIDQVSGGVEQKVEFKFSDSEKNGKEASVTYTVSW